MFRSSLFLFFAATSVFAQGAFSPSSDAVHAAEVITDHSLMAHIRFLSDDLLEGRAPGTRGDVLSRTYVASQMELLGLKPGGDRGTWFQRVPIVSMKTDPSTALHFLKGSSTVDLAFGSQFVAMAGEQTPSVSLRNAELLFVGYGIVAPEYGWDDYKGVDVKGKVLLMLNNDPAGDDPTFFGGKARLYYGRWTYKFEIAAAKGAAGAIVIHTTESAGYGWNVVESSWGGTRSELAQAPGAPTTKMRAWATREATDAILSLAGKTFDDLNKRAQKKSFKPVPLGVTVSTTIATTLQQVVTSNVIGVLPGSDPLLRDQAVILTAHYDHLGIGKPTAGDSIYNGALDNATGVSALLNLAHAFTALTTGPRRTIIVAAVGAEESGLIGSQFYAENPTVAPGRIAANINIDGINIFGKTRDIIMVGLGKSSIDDVLKSVASWQGRIVKGDQFPEQGSFYRSDQFNFARIGVPCMYLDAGVDYVGKPADFGKKKVEEYIAKNYHQVSDEIGPDWQLDGGIQDLQLTFFVGLRLADNDAMPVWNKGDEFEAARLAALRNVAGGPGMK